MQEYVVLVDEKDQIIGQMEKQEAHENGLLHRAFSVFLFNDKGEMLLQKRASSKYHSPDQWTNACCSHPRIGEDYEQAANRRLKEELGIVAKIEKKFHFIYKAKVGNHLWEHELDHVFTGVYNGDFQLNPSEISEVRYVSMEILSQEIKEYPHNFTPWFRIIFEEFIHHF